MKQEQDTIGKIQKRTRKKFWKLKKWKDIYQVLI